jgi:hypothetical protein
MKTTINLIALALVAVSLSACSGSGEGGKWTPADTAAAAGALNTGLGAVHTGVDTYNSIAHPEYYYRPSVVAPGAVMVHLWDVPTMEKKKVRRASHKL